MGYSDKEPGMTGDDLGFQIGKLTGQVTALVAQVSAMTATIALLDDRLRKNETNTTVLTVKMSLIGVFSGSVGSLAVSIIQHYFIK